MILAKVFKIQVKGVDLLHTRVPDTLDGNLCRFCKTFLAKALVFGFIFSRSTWLVMGDLPSKSDDSDLW